jgi:hypothetical protein
MNICKTEPSVPLSLISSVLYIKMLVFSYIFMPVLQEAETCSTFWTIKYIFCKYSCGCRSICLCIYIKYKKNSVPTSHKTQCLCYKDQSITAA